MNPTDSSSLDPIRIAIPSKGHLHDGIVEILKSAGYKVKRASERQYVAKISGRPRFDVVFLRPADIVAQVQEGRCHLGVTGYDVFAERAFEAEQAKVVIKDLGYADCKLVVAVPESWIDVTHIMDLVDLTAEFKAQGRTFRVSTKYPALTKHYFREWGIYYYQIVDSDGALEIQPSLGISDIIVDLTSSGATLKDNRLREIEKGVVLESAACLIGHAPGLRKLIAEGESGPLALLLDAIDVAKASEGRLHVEIVVQGEHKASEVAAYLRDQGARHVAWGEIRVAPDLVGRRVTAMIDANRLPPCRRALLALGALRVVGIPARFVFDREDVSTFDRIAREIG